METRDLCYWLQGHLELNPDLKTLTADQVQIVRNHLAMTIKHSKLLEGTPEPKPKINLHNWDGKGERPRC